MNSTLELPKSLSTTSALPSLLVEGDPRYEEARRVWNAMVDRRPAAIAPCASAAEVAAAVRFGREAGLEIGVRCGGHNIAGLAVPEGGLMIDLRPLCHVEVDPTARRARVGGGAMLGALDRAAQRHGLATTAGNVSHTGVGGLTLGGGMGWLARKHGLTCDNVLAYTLVTAAGEIVRVDGESDPDLFWALRGGGGNFGIVVEFEFRLHPVGTRALSVELAFDAAGAGEALAGWRELAHAAPREATFTASLSGTEVKLGYVWVGDRADGTRLLPALRRLGDHRGERVEALSYLRLQSREDTVEGHERRRYWKGQYMGELSDAAIARLLADREADLCPNVSLQTYGGAIAEQDDDASAFSHRGTRFEYVAATGWVDPAEDEARMGATRAAAARLAPFASGAYVNALSDEGRVGVERAYSAPKLARLTAVKDAVDPENVFHLNHNIVPSGN
jgi:FAD/FMN-containing dehydrogenase